MVLLYNIIVVLISFLMMELVSWATHKYIMHGFLWKLHEDHHNVNKNKTFEKNDSFFLIFAIPGAGFIMYGIETNSILLLIGLGITLYGLAYFFVHEIFIHQRIKVFRKTNNKYLKGLRKAHKIHHKNQNKENGQCFGMLIVPLKYFKDYK